MEETVALGSTMSGERGSGLSNQQVDQLLAIYGERVPVSCISSLREMLQSTKMTYSEAQVTLMQMKDPTISLILSVILGHLGVDRFYLGDIGLGVIKLITCGGLAVWWVVDMFLIMDRTKMKNYELLTQVLV